MRLPRKDRCERPRVSTSDTCVAPVANPAVLSDGGVAAAASQVASALDTWPGAGVVGAALQAANVFAVPGPARTSKAVVTPLATRAPPPSARPALRRFRRRPAISCTRYSCRVDSRNITQSGDGWGFENVHLVLLFLLRERRRGDGGRVFELCTGAGQTRADGADRNTECRCRVWVRELAPQDKKDNILFSLGERRHRFRRGQVPLALRDDPWCSLRGSHRPPGQVCDRAPIDNVVASDQRFE